MKSLNKIMDIVLEKLSDNLGGFYLAGGTALSKYYFHHRDSYDLDFFTKDFQREKIFFLMENVSKETGRDIDLVVEQSQKGRARMLIFSMKVDKDQSLKIDFVEDVFALLKPLGKINGIPVLSKEDIYLRKIFAACGNSEVVGQAGRKGFMGGRQEAKDLFDIYFLSKTFMPLSKFAAAHCNPAQIESIILWFNTYNRMDMKLGLQEIVTDKQIDFRDIERHFKMEVDRIIEKQI